MTRKIVTFLISILAIMTNIPCVITACDDDFV